MWKGREVLARDFLKSKLKMKLLNIEKKFFEGSKCNNSIITDQQVHWKCKILDDEWKEANSSPIRALRL